MLNASSRKNPESYRFVNGMQNLAYITGFVRHPKDGMFYVQQTNNLDLSLPIEVDQSVRLPREFAPVTVLCRVGGETRADGQRVVRLRAIDITTPSTRSMPTLVAWAQPLPDGAKEDSFRPFGDNGNLKGAVSDQIAEPEHDAENVVRAILEATKGKLDTRLGENANTVILSGIVEAASIVKANEFQKAYLGVLLRQGADSEKCVPLRLISNNLGSHQASLSVGRPVKVIGQARTKLVMSEDGKEVVDRLAYIRCHELKVASFGDDIKAIPDWLYEMKNRLLAERQAKQRAKETAGGGTEVVEGL